MAVVLYVEDEEDDIFFMRRAFRGAGLAHVLNAVTDGQAAIDYLVGRGCYADRVSSPFPQLVLLDLNLPLVSGFQVLKWIRLQPAICKLPVVIFSSSARQEDKVHAEHLGASGYLEKPGNSVEFQAIAKTLAAKWLPTEVAALPTREIHRPIQPTRLL